MNKTKLYVVIAVLFTVNVITLTLLFNRNFYSPFSMMGGHFYDEKNEDGSMMHDSDDHNHSTDEFSSWEDMQEHMEKEHRLSNTGHKLVDYNKPVAETHENTYDFGKIKKTSGVVSAVFEIENHGREPLILSDISTSCGCTTAELNVTELGFDEKAKLTVYFDPNFHKEPLGKITRSVFVKTNDVETPELQFDIYVEIID